MRVNKPDSTSLTLQYLGWGRVYLSEGWEEILIAVRSQLSAPKTLSTAIILPPAVFPGAAAAFTPRRSHSSHLKSPAAVNGQERDMETTEETNPERRAGRKTPSLFSLANPGETPADAADTKRRQRVISVAGPQVLWENGVNVPRPPRKAVKHRGSWGSVEKEATEMLEVGLALGMRRLGELRTVFHRDRELMEGVQLQAG